MGGLIGEDGFSWSQKTPCSLCPIPSTRACHTHDAVSQALTLEGLPHNLCQHRVQPHALNPLQRTDYVKGIPDFQFETIPDGLPPSDRDATQDVSALSDSTRKNCLAPFKELLLKLNSSSGVPPVSCIVSDGITGFGRRAGKELGIPEVQFWTASACSFIGYLHFSELINRGIVPFKVSKSLKYLASAEDISSKLILSSMSDESFMHDGTLDTPINWIPGMKNIRLKDLPSSMRTTDITETMFDFMGSEAQSCLDSSAIIINTFDEFDYEALEAISAKFPRSIYTIGPIPLLGRHMPDSPLKSLSASLWKEDPKCLQWLDRREPNSVVYVNYGSVTVMTEQHLKEFAWGLASSKQPFLWIVRPDVAWRSTDDVKRDEIAALVKEMMEGDKGKAARHKALEWKKKAEEVTDIDGSSYKNFERLIKEAHHEYTLDQIAPKEALVKAASLEANYVKNLGNAEDVAEWKFLP
ncbi:UDP-glycosyltransferase 85A5 [Morella rubra]|uniref:UDP-glycosyltransferase 85A5 n=1 Tax=Morella rubra TaxID=262757 RepID=A0A6A1VBT2_9ROSI|nr:UDP-glycosyltransferase 85A5 [Morella rubra]